MLKACLLHTENPPPTHGCILLAHCPVLPQQHYWWAGAMKAAFPGSLLVSPLSLYLAHRGQLPVDVKVTPLAGHQDLPGSWPLDTLDMLTVRGG